MDCSMRRVQYVLPTQSIVCPGQSKTHNLLSFVGYACIARYTSFLTLSLIILSNSISHFSTCPLVASVDIASIRSTSSPSVDRIASTSRSSSNLNECIPSKHFLKCGCTLKDITQFERFSYLGIFHRIFRSIFFSSGRKVIKVNFHYRVGSFVSDKISNNSSLDRKKNLGKKRRFLSRYSFKPFWISSNNP